MEIFVNKIKSKFMKKELVKKEKEIRLEKELKKNLKRRKIQAKKRSFFGKNS